METRRGFLKGASAGIVFCSCGLLDAARAQHRVAKRLPVMVRGKRIRTIDVHAHCVFTDAVALLGAGTPPATGPAWTESRSFNVDERIKNMDTMAIDMEVMSINPFWYHKDRDTAAAVVKLQNEKMPL